MSMQRRTGVAIGAAVSMLAVGSVWSSSYAAFTATTSNDADSWQAGTVTLADDATGSALFSTANAGNIAPGGAGEKCITVEYGGSLDANVRVYADTTGYTRNALADQLLVTITQGSANGNSGFGDCTDFVPDTLDGMQTGNVVSTRPFSTFAGVTDWATASIVWSLSGEEGWTPIGLPPGYYETKVYKIEWSLPSSVDNSAQGQSFSLGFVWEAQDA
jgi:hypothetical protein